MLPPSRQGSEPRDSTGLRPNLPHSFVVCAGRCPSLRVGLDSPPPALAGAFAPHRQWNVGGGSFHFGKEQSREDHF